MNHPASSGRSHISGSPDASRPSGRSGSASASSPSPHSGSTGASGSSNLSGLSGLSDRVLLSRIKTLRHKEHALTLAVVLHLIEIERRRLFRELGYGSLFDYCIQHLNYSPSAAGRRIQTARCIRRFPEVYDLLEREEVNLSTVSLIAPVLTEENKEMLLTGIRQKSQRDVEMLVARYRPTAAFRDRVRPVCVVVPRFSGAPAQARVCETSDYSRSGSGKKPNSTPGGDTAPGSGTAQYNGAGMVAGNLPAADTTADNGSANRHASVPATRLERKLHIQFLASEAFMKKYEEVRSLLSNRHTNASFERVFETLIDEFLERHSPRKRQERRQAGRKHRSEQNPTHRPRTTKVASKKRTAKRTANCDLSRHGTPRAPEAPACLAQRGLCETSDYSRSGSGKRPKSVPDTQKRSRRIPAAVRDKVFVRDGGRCTYVGTTGKRCGSTRNLHVDHVTPFARCGPPAAGNLRLLCAEHNRLAAEKSFGADHMKRFRRRE